MKSVKILPRALNGGILVPPSKSVAHRIIIGAALAEGESRIDNIDFSDDITATCRGMETMGALIKNSPSCEYEGRAVLDITGTYGSKKMFFKNSVLDCFESGSTARFLIPLTRLISDKITITGKGRLSSRPFGEYYKIFDEQDIEYSTHNGKLPLEIEGKLKPGKFSMRGDVSSQFITGLLFTLPLLPSESEIYLETPLQSKGYIDLTLNVLAKFGIVVKNDNYEKFYIPGSQKYIPINSFVEGDYSQAAFWAVAGVIGETLIVKGVQKDSLQGDKEIFDIIEKMGGIFKRDKEDVIVYPSDIKAVDIDASQIPDLVPILAVLASFAKGTTRIYNAERLRIKESDRLKAISTELSNLGAKIKEVEDGLIIEGQNKLIGGNVKGWNDHRIVMALAIASIRCIEPVIIEGADAVKKSYPGFWEDFKMLGGSIE